MTSFLSQIWVQRLGWSLLHFLWQGTAIAVLHAIVRYVFARGASAHARYVLACAALVAVAVAPPLTFLVISRAGAVSAASPWTISVAGWAGTLPIVVVVWLVGVFGFSLRLIGACRMTKRLRRASHPAPSEWQARMGAIASGMSRRMRSVKLLVSPMVQVPIVIGHLRPAILVPVTFLTGLPAEQIEALLAHELAHIRRNDYLVSVLQSIAEVVLFYHPAVWWISRQIREEREFCCDDLTITAGVDVLTYSRALATLETTRPSFRLQPAANSGSLLDRIRRLVGATHETANYLPGAATAWAMIALWVIGAGVTTAHGAQTLVASKTPVNAVASMYQSELPELPNTVLPSVIRKTLLFDPFLSAQVAQVPPPAGLNTDAKATQNLMLERVTAVDSGKSLEGLRQTDFTLSEDGAAQSIAFFDYENTGWLAENSAVSPLPAARPLPALPTATIAGDLNGKPLYRDHRLLVLYFDVTSMSAQDQSKAFDAASRFVNTQMTRIDAVSIMRYSGHNAEVLQDFTGDRARLLAVLATMAANPSTPPAISAADAEFGAFSPDGRVRALRDAATLLGSLSERKALLYISGGLNISGADNRSQMRTALSAATRFGVSIYPLDGRAPVAGEREITGRDALTTLATDSGGQAMLDAVDLARSIGAVERTLGSYYVIGYNSPGSAADGKAHRVDVTLSNNPSATLTYARSYVDGQSGAGDPGTAIPVVGEVDAFRLNNVESNVPVTLRIPGSELALAKQTGADKTDLDYVFEIQDQLGTTVGSVHDGISIPLAASTAEELSKRSLTYATRFTLLPGAYTIKAVARDSATGNMGTYTSAFGIANLERAQGLPITSVVLSNRAPSSPPANRPARAPGGVDSPLVQEEGRLNPNATRVFSASGSLYVYLQAYEKGAANTVPLTAHISFFKGQADMLESTPVMVSDGLEPASKMLPIKLEIPLASLQPGEYDCQLTVLDPSTQKSAVWRQTVHVVP